MCGIAGFCDFRQNSTRELLVQMTDSLLHRGPDDAGYEVYEGAPAQIGLGQRRLSIMDLSPLGHQPMHFEQLSIVFNGEVYNFKEIQAELKALGYSFRSESDTEVILKAYHRWGMAMLDRFIGMFAFVLYDRAKQQVFLVRDRPGVKPLFYYYDGQTLLFASELKAFHQHPRFEKEIDLDALALFLQYNYVPTPYCIFKRTRKVQPGHYLQIDLASQKMEEVKYWDVYDAYNRPKLAISDRDAMDQTEQLLKSAYEYRMVADVPVGVFLSGGYDSVSVAALLQHGRTEKIKTFSIGYAEGAFNEAHHAKKVAEYLGTDHTEWYVTPQDAAAVIPTLPEIYDEPFADNSVVPTTLVSQLARRRVTVALSGDGGDEIFGGYHKFKQSVKYTEAIPTWIQLVLSRGMGLLNPESIPYFSRQYNFPSRYEKMQKIWAAQSAAVALKYISQYITEDEVASLMARPYQAQPTHFEDSGLLGPGNDSLNKLLAIDWKTFLLDNNLTKVDRATMSVALEGREPMLDHRVIEFVAQLPSSLKIRDGVTKYVLKEVVYRHVPKPLMERPKMPFIAPLTLWFRKELREIMLHYLNYDRLSAGGFFNPDVVVKMRDTYLAGGLQVGHQKLWNLLVFQMWLERWA
jgi:asparagine synthase (glutamine-hydrolysing)